MLNSNKKRSYRFDKLRKRLRRQVGQAIADFNMIVDGDKVMVCVSGGADSYTVLDILLELQLAAPVNFELTAVNLDQKQPGFPAQILPDYLSERNIPFHILRQDTYSIVKRIVPEGKTQCGLCSRLRRGILYTFAKKQGYTKIVLGHHRDDIVETLFLNLFYGGHIKAMPAKLLSDDKQHIVIRPLAYCKETDIKAYAKEKAFPIIPCTLCGAQENLQRQAIKQMLAKWQQQYPGRIESIFSALTNIVPSHLLDDNLFDFAALGEQAASTLAQPDVPNWIHLQQGTLQTTR